jgi:hypothetical protein
MRTTAVIRCLTMLLASACITPTVCGCVIPADGLVYGTVKTASGKGIPAAQLTLSARRGGCAAPAGDVTISTQGLTSTDSIGAFRVYVSAFLDTPICVRIAAEGVPAPGLVRSASGSATLQMRTSQRDSARIELTLVE